MWSMKPGDLICWKSEDRFEDVNECGMIISTEIVEAEDPRLNVHFTFFKGDKKEIEPIYNILWFYKDLHPYISTAHKNFIESWYEVVNKMD